jgi:alkanesulfonate monooxygenase
MAALRSLMSGRPVEMSGRFVDLVIDPPRVSMTSGRCPPFYFGGLSEEAKACAAAAADVYLMWPDTPDGVAAVVGDMEHRAGELGRKLRFGWRSHVIVRETEDEARSAARRLLSRLDPTTGRTIRGRSLDSASTGVARQAELRAEADGDGYVGRHLWTGIGRARSGAGAAIVGDPDQVLATLGELRDAGVDSFILSGYPHLHECDLFARHVLARMDHGPLDIPSQPVAGP